MISYCPRQKFIYKEKIIPALMKEFKYSTVMQVPKLEKIVISQCIGVAVKDKNILDNALEDIKVITGQKAVLCLSKCDEAGFNLRKNIPIGCKVTLRNIKMYEFLDRLITSALPRIRDFTGVKSSSFDGRGNYNLGIYEQIIFPEIDIYKIKRISGLNIAFITSANTDKESKSLLFHFGIPFKKNMGNV